MRYHSIIAAWFIIIALVYAGTTILLLSGKLIHFFRGVY